MQREGRGGERRQHERLAYVLRVDNRASQEISCTVVALLISPTHKRTEGRAPVWGSEFTSKRRRTTGGILKQSSLRRVRSNNLKLASWRAELVVRAS